MVTFGKGGWTWDVVYNLPIHLRKFYVTELAATLNQEREAIDKSRRPSPKNMPRPPAP